MRGESQGCSPLVPRGLHPWGMEDFAIFASCENLSLMPSLKIKAPIEPGCTYHIYNRGSNYQNVFFRKDDYQLFLDRLKHYMTDCCSIYAFALLPNHYHLLLQVNEESQNPEFSNQYAKFILSYTNRINFRERRNGSLFLSYFRRIKVDNEDYLKKLIFYIHFNPEKHGITGNFRTYSFCSYKIFLSDRPTNLERDVVLDWFDGLENFIGYHELAYEVNLLRKLALEI